MCCSSVIRPGAFRQTAPDGRGHGSLVGNLINHFKESLKVNKQNIILKSWLGFFKLPVKLGLELKNTKPTPMRLFMFFLKQFVTRIKPQLLRKKILITVGQTV